MLSEWCHPLSQVTTSKSRVPQPSSPLAISNQQFPYDGRASSSSCKVSTYMVSTEYNIRHRAHIVPHAIQQGNSLWSVLRSTLLNEHSTHDHVIRERSNVSDDQTVEVHMHLLHMYIHVGTLVARKETEALYTVPAVKTNRASPRHSAQYT